MVADSEIQRIARLTPLADVLASFDLSVGPVEPREEAVSKALGLTLAASVVIAAGHPKAALALRDGYAVRSDATLDASSYAPAPLSPAPTTRRQSATPCRRAPTRWPHSTPCRYAARNSGARRGRARRGRAGAERRRNGRPAIASWRARACGGSTWRCSPRSASSACWSASRGCAWCRRARATSFAAPRRSSPAPSRPKAASPSPATPRSKPR